MTVNVQKIAEQVKALPQEEFDEFLAWLADYELEHAAPQPPSTRCRPWCTKFAVDSADFADFAAGVKEVFDPHPAGWYVEWRARGEAARFLLGSTA